MIIALDASYSVGEELSGLGLYSRWILDGLAAAHPEARFDFCYRPHRYRASREMRLPANARRRLLVDQFGPFSAAARADLFHGLHQRLPRTRLRRAVATFHDLFVMTGEYSTPEFRNRFTSQARDAAARADAVIAVSAFTKRQVVELLGFPPDRIHVVHHGVRALPYPAVPREKVVLSVGAVQERKNIAGLVAAFEALDPGWRLVLAGSYGYGAAAIQERIERSPARQRISVLGYVPSQDLAGWYARATIFAFPSLDEGFGMPVLEAMAAGTPVLTSDCSSLPEVAGDAAILVDPRNAGQLAAELCRLAEDAALRSELASRGRARAARFTWQKAVRETWGVYQRVLAG